MYFIGIFNKDFPKEHMTIAFLGECSEITLTSACNDIGEAPYEFDVKIVGEDNFGPYKDVPVWLVKISDSLIRASLTRMWSKYNVEQEHTKGLSTPNFHISKREMKDSPSKKRVGDIIHLKGLFVKECGGEIIALKN